MVGLEVSTSGRDVEQSGGTGAVRKRYRRDDLDKEPQLEMIPEEGDDGWVGAVATSREVCCCGLGDVIGGTPRLMQGVSDSRVLFAMLQTPGVHSLEEAEGHGGPRAAAAPRWQGALVAVGSAGSHSGMRLSVFTRLC